LPFRDPNPRRVPRPTTTHKRQRLTPARTGSRSRHAIDRQAITAHDDGRYGGSCEARWNGRDFWSAYQDPYVMAEQLAFLRGQPTLGRGRRRRPGRRGGRCGAHGRSRPWPYRCRYGWRCRLRRMARASAVSRSIRLTRPRPPRRPASAACCCIAADTAQRFAFGVWRCVSRIVADTLPAQNAPGALVATTLNHEHRPSHYATVNGSATQPEARQIHHDPRQTAHAQRNPNCSTWPP
jgi:hypothetical protein